MAWAWTTPGQDVLKLVQSVNGASLRLSPTGEALREDYAAWRRGESIRAGSSAGVAPSKGAATNDELVKRVETLEATVRRLEKNIHKTPSPQ